MRYGVVLLLLFSFIAAAFPLQSQEPKFQPPDPNLPSDIVQAHFVLAILHEDGRVLFDVFQGDQPPELLAKLDGKDAATFGVDGKPLDAAEVKKRIRGWTAVVVVPLEFELPHERYRNTLNERTVLLAVNRTLWTPIANAAKLRRKPGEIAP